MLAVTRPAGFRSTAAPWKGGCVKVVIAGPLVAPEHEYPGHPERPSRVEAVARGIDDLGLDSDRVDAEPREATFDELAAVHDPQYLRSLEAFCEAGGGKADPDTFATRVTWDAARAAAGAGLAAVDALASGRGDVAFVAARPPGHHALENRAMGFCLVNNVAVAARRLADAGERVVIIDWDVHHGNGTEALFWDDDRVCYVSTHEDRLYPGTGAVDDTGGAGAPGLTVNLPLPRGATGDVIERALDDVVAPVVERFAPTWVLVSAGFDAHRADPLAGLELSSGDYARLANIVRGYAPSAGRLAFFLEGGYDLDALRVSAAATLGAITGADIEVEPPTSGGPGEQAVARARAIQAA
jgi:acetoin utilization deacetylase AcuC-like enzyme